MATEQPKNNLLGILLLSGLALFYFKPSVSDIVPNFGGHANFNEYQATVDTAVSIVKAKTHTIAPDNPEPKPPGPMPRPDLPDDDEDDDEWPPRPPREESAEEPTPAENKEMTLNINLVVTQEKEEKSVVTEAPKPEPKPDPISFPTAKEIATEVAEAIKPSLVSRDEIKEDTKALLESLLPPKEEPKETKAATEKPKMGLLTEDTEQPKEAPQEKKYYFKDGNGDTIGPYLFKDGYYYRDPSTTKGFYGRPQTQSYQSYPSMGNYSSGFSGGSCGPGGCGSSYRGGFSSGRMMGGGYYGGSRCGPGGCQ